MANLHFSMLLVAYAWNVNLLQRIPAFSFFDQAIFSNGIKYSSGVVGLCIPIVYAISGNYSLPALAVAAMASFGNNSLLTSHKWRRRFRRN